MQQCSNATTKGIDGTHASQRGLQGVSEGSEQPRTMWQGSSLNCQQSICGRTHTHMHANIVLYERTTYTHTPRAQSHASIAVSCSWMHNPQTITHIHVHSHTCIQAAHRKCTHFRISYSCHISLSCSRFNLFNFLTWYAINPICMQLSLGRILLKKQVQVNSLRQEWIQIYLRVFSFNFLIEFIVETGNRVNRLRLTWITKRENINICGSYLTMAFSAFATPFNLLLLWVLM